MRLSVLEERRTVSAVAAFWVVAFAIATWALQGREQATLILSDVVYAVPIVAATLLAVVAAARTSGASRRFWAVLAVSNGLWLLGEITWAVYELGLGREAPFPSLADAFYITSYALVVPAIVLRFRPAPQGRVLRALLDASIIVIVLGYAGYHFLIEPQLAFGWSVATATGIAYPLLGVVILMVLLSLGFGGHRKVPRSVVVVGIAFGVAAITDTAYTYAVVLHEYLPGSYLNVGWQLEAVLLCVGAIVAITGSEKESTPEYFVRDRSLAMDIIGVSAAFALIGVEVAFHGLHVGVVLVGLYASAALMLRLYLTSREKHGLAASLAESLESLERVDSERRALLHRIVRAREDERVRLAAELHDGPIQQLSPVGVRLSVAQERLDAGSTTDARAALGASDQQVSAVIEELRRLMTDLRPPALDERGLGAALADHFAEFEKDTGVDSTLSVSLDERLDPDLETVLYRVTQEALANVARHARATEVKVSLTSRKGRVELEVADDGRGFHPSIAGATGPDGHFGIQSMRERVEMAGGEWVVRSVPGKGTQIHATFGASS